MRVALVHDWIRTLPVRTDERLLVRRLRNLDETEVLAREAENAERDLNRLARDFAACQRLPRAGAPHQACLVEGMRAAGT